VATLGSALLAGCSGNDDTERTTEQSSPRTTTRGNQNGSETTTPTHTETTAPTHTETTAQDEQLLEQTYVAEDLDDVVGRLEYGNATLNFQPVDENADYASSILFDEDRFNGELQVTIDLNQAEQQRHHNQRARQHPAVQEFIQNIQDTDWRIQLLDEAGVENPEDRIDWETYTDSSLSYRERMRESNMIPLWYTFESERLGGISSTNNHYKATALQELETQLGFDTFIWDYGIPGHGLVSAIENPTRSEEDTDRQETYIVETGNGYRQQVVPWSESQYQNTELHPAREGVDRATTKEGFYGRTAIGADEAELYESVNVPMSGAEQFIEFFRNPEISPAYDHLDPLTAGAYIAEENIVNGDVDGTVTLRSDSVRLST
jgi:hypothetical protein